MIRLFDRLYAGAVLCFLVVTSGWAPQVNAEDTPAPSISDAATDQGRSVHYAAAGPVFNLPAGISVKLDANVPLLYDLNGEAPWLRLPSDVQEKLKASSLLDLSAAQWNYQASFEWDQAFEPGETHMQVSYTPVATYWSDITVDHFPEIAPGGSATEAYCIDEALRRAFFRNPFVELYTVTHLENPATEWRGPVGQYRLMVDKAAATNLVAFCPLSAKKTSPTTFEWTAKDVILDHAIGALFFVDPDATGSNLHPKETCTTTTANTRRTTCR